MSTKQPRPKQVSALLYEVLRTSSTFDAFCLDRFQDVYRRFSNGMDRDARHTMLLAEHDVDKVVAELRDYDPDRFTRYAPQLLGTKDTSEPPITEAPARPGGSSPILRVSCFCAQADKDQAVELRKRLVPLLDDSKVVFWSVRDLQPGDSRTDRIRHELNTADVLLFLTSADLFADSDAADWLELALQRQRTQSAAVIPILARPAVFPETRFADLASLPANGRELSRWRNQDEAWVDIIQGLRQLLQNKSSGKTL